ncbi:MAG: hypothetical protein M3O71_04485 [Bacteroidota bacterium]|nr:hypothetical protein [Bacteroidota bacterium]
MKIYLCGPLAHFGAGLRPALIYQALSGPKERSYNKKAEALKGLNLTAQVAGL